MQHVIRNRAGEEICQLEADSLRQAVEEAAGRMGRRGTMPEQDSTRQDTPSCGMLRGADLRGADLSGASLRRAILTGANLQWADLQGADLRGAFLSESNLANADLRGADLTGATMAGVNLRWADMVKAYLTEANLTRANLQGVDLTGAKMTRANLQGANLQVADLYGGDLAWTNLSGAKLQLADLDDANLSRCDLSGAYLSLARLVCANLEGANLHEADLSEIRDDIYAVLRLSPNEVPALSRAIHEGRINGSVYEGSCACLVGTLAKARGCHYNTIPGLFPDCRRPAERWFLALNPGNTPATSPVAKITAEWIDEWLASNQSVPS